MGLMTALGSHAEKRLVSSGVTICSEFSKCPRFNGIVEISQVLATSANGARRTAAHATSVNACGIMNVHADLLKIYEKFGTVQMTKRRGLPKTEHFSSKIHLRTAGTTTVTPFMFQPTRAVLKMKKRNQFSRGCSPSSREK
mmetsp:Transcript_23323/g.28073  ORF Transcript_23323/g.28073 Transcript_23323/m.28073 type:complete len:141 (+) Transcript_23323:271-693(+)